MQSDAGTVAQRVASEQTYTAVRFSVDPDQTVYVGRILTRMRAGTNVFGGLVRAGARMEMHDDFDADKPLLLANGAINAGTEVANGTPDFTATPDGLLVRPDRLSATELE